MLCVFDVGQEQWYPDEEVAICECDSCGVEMYEGEDGYYTDDGLVICEECFDKILDSIRRDKRIEINKEALR